MYENYIFGIAEYLYSFSFELALNTGRENNQAFAVLHASNDLDFTCQKIVIEDKIHFECEIMGVVDNKLSDQVSLLLI